MQKDLGVCTLGVCFFKAFMNAQINSLDIKQKHNRTCIYIIFKKVLDEGVLVLRTFTMGKKKT